MQYIFSVGTSSSSPPITSLTTHTRHLDTFPGEGILFGAPHNTNIDADKEGYERVGSWAEVRELFLND